MHTLITKRFGRGFSKRNIEQMRLFYLCWPIAQTVSAQLGKEFASDEKIQTMSAQFSLKDLAQRFPLPWSHYVKLLAVQNPEGRAFYEAEALRGG
jgi:hypothetical protein